MKFLYSAIISVFISVAAFSAFSMDFKQARSEGLIHEQADGYVKVVKSSPEIETIAKEVNAKRLAEYQRISKENGQPVDVVAKLAAEQIQSKLK